MEFPKSLNNVLPKKLSEDSRYFYRFSNLNLIQYFHGKLLLSSVIFYDDSCIQNENVTRKNGDFKPLVFLELTFEKGILQNEREMNETDISKNYEWRILFLKNWHGSFIWIKKTLIISFVREKIVIKN